MPISVHHIAQPDPEMREGLDKIYMDYPDYSWSKLCDLWQQDNYSMYSAFFNGKWIACAMVNLDDGGKIANLDYLCVHPATRKRGVGKDLINKISELLKTHGVTTIEIPSGRPEESETFFSKSGFCHRENSARLVRSII